MATIWGRAASLGRATMQPYFDALDWGPMRDQTLTAAPTFPPFKFEPRRARIDWRMLHGVDVNYIVRDADLDTLEKVVSIIAFGDIEAEDTRHLTELNFIKVFRLAQLTIEYLLYVQDCLQTTNAWLQTDRTNSEKYLQAARMRVRELEAHLKMSKRELRRARKTAKTYEAMTALGKGLDTTGAHAGIRSEAATVSAHVMQEAMLRRELSIMTERLGRAQSEAVQLRAEREDMYLQLKDIEAALASGRGVAAQALPPSTKALQDQLSRAQAELRALKREKEDKEDRTDQDSSSLSKLQDEKMKLLRELAARSGGSVGGPEGSGGAGNLGEMLLEAENQKRQLEAQLGESQADVAALRKQLMKAMKDAAKPGSAADGAGGASREAVARAQELERRVSELTGELQEKRKAQQDLEDELDMTRQAAVDAQRKLADVKRQQQQQQTEAAGTKAAGLVRVTDEDQSEQQAARVLLQRKLAQAHEERVQLEDELRNREQQVEATKQMLEGARQQAEGARQQVEVLKGQLEAARLRAADADRAEREVAAMRQQLEQMKQAWRELKAQLSPEVLHGTASAPGGAVRQKVDEFERLAQRSAAAHEPPVPSTALANVATAFGASPASALEGSFRFDPPAATATRDGAGSSGTAPSTPVSKLPDASASRWTQGEAAAAGVPVVHRPVRPSEAEMRRIKADLMRRVSDMTPDQLNTVITDELRVVTENPYEYQEDDERNFHLLLPHEVQGKKGVRSMQPHTLDELQMAVRKYSGVVLGQLDDQVASFGIDPTQQGMSDKEYAAAMLELADRRQAVLSRLSPEAQEAAEFLRETLLTHVELMKRGVEQQGGMANVGGAIMPPGAPPTSGAAAATGPGMGAGQQQQPRGGWSGGAGGGVGAGQARAAGPAGGAAPDSRFLSDSIGGALNASLAIPQQQQQQQQQQGGGGGGAGLGGAGGGRAAPPSGAGSGSLPLPPSHWGTLINATSLGGAASHQSSRSDSPLNQSLGALAGRYSTGRGGGGGDGAEQERGASEQLPSGGPLGGLPLSPGGGPMTSPQRSSASALSPLDQSLKRQAAAASGVSSLNQSLSRPSSLLPPAPVRLPGGGSAAIGGGSALSPGSTGTGGGGGGGGQLGSGGGGGVTSMNMSLRSTGSPSRREEMYANSDDSSGSAGAAGAGRGRGGGGAASVEEEELEEVDLEDDEDGAAIDFGVSGDVAGVIMPKIVAAAAAASGATGDRAGGGIGARVGSLGGERSRWTDDLAGPSAGTGLAGGRIASSHLGEGSDGQAADELESIQSFHMSEAQGSLGNSMRGRGQAAGTSGWVGGGGGAGVGVGVGGTMASQRSVGSAGSGGAAALQLPAPRGGGAWGSPVRSPETTMRGPAGPSRLGQQGSLRQQSSVEDEEIQAFASDATLDEMLEVGRQQSGASRAASGAVQRQGSSKGRPVQAVRQVDSMDSVSDVEFF